MLLSLHVKNLALIKETEIIFDNGLQILSGETGAGKSILLGALGLALGEKPSKGFLRDGEEEALVEATFRVNPSEEAVLRDMDIDVYDHEIILSRKISSSRSTARINGESVPAVKMKEVGAYLIDIYGQHEHQSLLKKESHKKLLDQYAQKDIAELLESVEKAYRQYQKLLISYQADDTDEAARMREADFLRHEIAEIEEARLQDGEDEALEEQYRKLLNSNKIMSGISEAIRYTDAERTESISRALRAIKDVEQYDASLFDYAGMLEQAEELLQDVHRGLDEYDRNSEFDERAFYETERRLNEINRLKEKYADGKDTVLAVLEALADKRKRLETLEDYETYLASLKEKCDKAKHELYEKAELLSEKRKAIAQVLQNEITKALLDLNFMGVSFAIQIERLLEAKADGLDDVTFMISVNPGEPIHPLHQVASGGELSRIMLAIKTVWAKEEGIDTLIFDEIDAGISGRTAAAVSEKLSDVAKHHQVICITHLPQIASMADRHFCIEKSVLDERTISDIRLLDETGRTEELARMLGGADIREAALNNAKELIEEAKNYKINS